MDPALPNGEPAAPRSAWQRLLESLHRYRYILAPLSFGAGLASFVLIERREYLAQWLSVLLLLGWLLILVEEAAARKLRLPRGLLRYGIQAVQQETFFFALPFFLHTTTWSTGQGAFTGAVIVAALCSMWDPLYYDRIATRPWLYVLFHAFAVFIGTLVIAPLLLHLTTGQTLALASASVAVLAVPSLLHLVDRARPLSGVLMVGGAMALGGLGWLAKPWVPPATLWVTEALATDSVDPATRAPGFALWSLAPVHLHQQGLYAYTAIHAPRGLREQVFHRWLLNGKEVDRIPMTIAGGRDEGYRAWSYKRGFPQDPRGQWQVQIVTDGGQLIGEFGFEVIGQMPAGVPALPAGPPGAGPATEQPDDEDDEEADAPPATAPVEAPPESAPPSAVPTEPPPSDKAPGSAPEEQPAAEPESAPPDQAPDVSPAPSAPGSSSP